MTPPGNAVRRKAGPLSRIDSMRRWPRILALIALLVVVAIAGYVLLPIPIFVMPPNGDFTIGRGTWATWKQGFRCRDWISGADWLLQRECDLDGDGRVDCREDDCRGEGAPPYCVFLRSDGRWRAASAEARDCGEEGVSKAAAALAPAP